MLAFLVIISMASLSFISSHSWIECTNYMIESKKDAEYYDKAKCMGFPRCGTRQKKAGFGHDTGFELHQKTKDQCQCADDANNAYTKEAPMAVYKPGQKVCLAYPPKNHVAEKCTNRYIPDQGTKIIRSKHPNEKLGKDRQFYQHLNGKHEKGKIDYKGFQNCPKFCEDKGSSLCTMCFNLEDNILPGKYSFQWVWQFNTGDYPYVTCWEAEVKGANGDSSKKPKEDKKKENEEQKKEKDNKETKEPSVMDPCDEDIQNAGGD